MEKMSKDKICWVCGKKVWFWEERDEMYEPTPDMIVSSHKKCFKIGQTKHITFDKEKIIKIINLGCGDENYGNVRVDFVKTNTTTHVLNLNKRFPFKDNEFDEVYSRSVLEHIKNIGIFVSEAMRILKKNGKLWIRTDNASYLPFHLRNHQGYIEGTYNHHISEDKHFHLFKEEHLKNLIDKVKSIKINYTCPSKKLFFLPNKFKCMHIEMEVIK